MCIATYEKGNINFNDDGPPPDVFELKACEVLSFESPPVVKLEVVGPFLLLKLINAVGPTSTFPHHSINSMCCTLSTVADTKSE